MPAIVLTAVGCGAGDLPALRGMVQEFIDGHWSESQGERTSELITPSDDPSRDSGVKKWELYCDAAQLIEGLDAVGGYWAPQGDWRTDELWGLGILVKRRELHSDPRIMASMQIANRAVRLDGRWAPGMCSFGELRTGENLHPTFQAGNALYWLFVAEAMYQLDEGNAARGVEGIVFALNYALDWAVSGDPAMEMRGLMWLASDRAKPYLSRDALGTLSTQQVTTIRTALAIVERSVSSVSNSPLNGLKFWSDKLLSDDAQESIEVSKEEIQWILDWLQQLWQTTDKKGADLRLSLEKLRRDRFFISDDWFVASILGRGDQAVLETRLHCQTVLAAQSVLLGLYLREQFSNVPDPQGGEIRFWKDGETIKVVSSGIGWSPSELFEL